MRRAADKLPAPLECEEQAALFEWATLASGRWPELALMYHIPNEGKRGAATGARLAREGLKKGMPDICLPVARGSCHALYIELKRKGEKPSEAQREWLAALDAQGNFAKWCEGWEAAAELITRYMRLRPYRDSYGLERPVMPTRCHGPWN